ncbi:MAG: PPK2 family polyphosphate kinase [Chitinophagales bacterium]
MNNMRKTDLLAISTLPPKDIDKKKIKKKTAKYNERLRELQKVMYAESKWALLIVLQGMDASGKDGATRDVFYAVNPQGVRVTSFKKPTPEEASHDFLWRVHKHAPAKGMIQVFNRSHYEEVLIVRVENWITEEETYRRFEHINNFEKFLHDSGTRILKFYLHISEESQKQDFYERATDPAKHWKYSADDLDKAKKWPEYRKAYEGVIDNCSPEDSPWIVVPSDKNWYKEYLISKHIVETLEALNMEYPEGEIDRNDPDLIKLVKEIED